MTCNWVWVISFHFKDWRDTCSSFHHLGTLPVSNVSLNKLVCGFTNPLLVSLKVPGRYLVWRGCFDDFHAAHDWQDFVFCNDGVRQNGAGDWGAEVGRLLGTFQSWRLIKSSRSGCSSCLLHILFVCHFLLSMDVKSPLVRLIYMSWFDFFSAFGQLFSFLRSLLCCSLSSLFCVDLNLWQAQAFSELQDYT